MDFTWNDQVVSHLVISARQTIVRSIYSVSQDWKQGYLCYIRIETELHIHVLVNYSGKRDLASNLHVNMNN